MYVVGIGLTSSSIFYRIRERCRNGNAFVMVCIVELKSIVVCNRIVKTLHNKVVCINSRWK